MRHMQPLTEEMATLAYRKVNPPAAGRFTAIEQDRMPEEKIR